MVFRLPPKMESHRYDTYGVVNPRSTHTREATCQEMTSTCTAIVGYEGKGDVTAPIFCPERHCGPHNHGWKTLVDVGTELGQRQARYIIDHSGRKWTAKQEGNAVTFTFPAGQKCFTEHRLPLDRPPLFTLKPVHSNVPQRPSVIDGYEWLDRFGTNQIRLKELHDRG